MCAETNICTEDRGIKARVKFALEQALKGWRGSRSIAVLFL
jgi:hypothetical protein